MAEKLAAPVVPVGTKAGGLTAEMAKMMGLRPGTAVTVGIIDAHAAVPGSSVVRPGTMCLVMGTSLCHMIVAKEFRPMAGICGVVEDGIIPGYFGYEAGQAGGGDILAWFVRNCVPEDYVREAKSSGIEHLRPAGTEGRRLAARAEWTRGAGLVEWKPFRLERCGPQRPARWSDDRHAAGKIYRALMESLAFGTRTIIENFERNGIRDARIVACGGLPEKNELLVQIFADVTGRTVNIAGSAQTTALGSAMFAAVAAGPVNGGYASLREAAKNMARLKAKSFKPIAANRKAYDALYGFYAQLYETFGRGRPDMIKALAR